MFVTFIRGNILNTVFKLHFRRTPNNRIENYFRPVYFPHLARQSHEKPLKLYVLADSIVMYDVNRSVVVAVAVGAMNALIMRISLMISDRR